MGKHSLPDRKINYYNVKVTKSKQMEIAIGICSDDCKSNQYSAARKNDVIYYHLAGRGIIECGNERKRVGVIVK